MDLELGTYSREEGLRLVWRPGYVLRASASGDAILISGNAEGLRSLAQHLLTLAEEHVPAGVHAHMDPDYELEDDSRPMIVEKIDAIQR